MHPIQKMRTSHGGLPQTSECLDALQTSPMVSIIYGFLVKPEVQLFEVSLSLAEARCLRSHSSEECPPQTTGSGHLPISPVSAERGIPHRYGDMHVMHGDTHHVSVARREGPKITKEASRLCR